MSDEPDSPTLLFSTALWNDAAARPVLVWNPTNALTKDMLDAGYHPVSDEFGFSYDGRQWRYQIAVNDLYERRVYYGEAGKWINAHWRLMMFNWLRRLLFAEEREEAPDGDEYVRRWPVSHQGPRPKDAGIWQRVRRGRGRKRKG